MASAVQIPDPVRFGVFEVDLKAAELRKNGIKLKLSGQPFQILTILLSRTGEVVTRGELQKQLWADTFVDGERNLNTVINKIREVLGDSADNPLVLHDWNWQQAEKEFRRALELSPQSDRAHFYFAEYLQVLAAMMKG